VSSPPAHTTTLFPALPNRSPGTAYGWHRSCLETDHIRGTAGTPRAAREHRGRGVAKVGLETWLRLAFQQARSDALSTLSTRGDADSLDVDALVAKLAEARTLLSHLKQIQAGVTKARAGLDLVKEHAVGMQTELLACLDECDRLAKGTQDIGGR
jgi:hypothetical protein